jgi:hypothetical protein
MIKDLEQDGKNGAAMSVRAPKAKPTSRGYAKRHDPRMAK